MNELKTNLSKVLDVPYYQQTNYQTCGPAALMMVMKYWDEKVEFSKDFEYKIWKKAKSISLKGGTLQFRMASYAKIKGFTVEIYQKQKYSNYHKFGKIFYSLFEFILSYKNRRLKIPIRYGKDIIYVIKNALSKKIPPIVFLNLEPITGENVFHWLVVTGLKENIVYVNDPDISDDLNDKIKKNIAIDLDVFRKAIATDTFKKLTFPFSFLDFPPCVVLVNK